MNLQTVQQIMNMQPITVKCQTPLDDIIKTLISSQQTQLPVVNSHHQLLGMVSLIDVQKALLVGAYHCDQPVKVNEIMAKEFICLSADEDLSEVAIKTQQQADNVFPVLKEDKLIGMMKRVDLLIYLQNNLTHCSQTK
jgi:CBS domain-containing protein